MNLNLRNFKSPAAVAGAFLLALGIANTAGAATALQGSIALRTLTPQDIKDYKLTGIQGASGLNTVGLGQPAYLEALVNKAVPAANITNVSWTLSAAPLGSTATLTASPLGTNVPTYKMADQVAFQVAGRTLLSPDVAGQYTVTVQVDTSSSGSTNLTQVINAGTYMGVGTCALCHSGGSGGAPNMVTPWSETAHATFFKRAVDGLESDHYSKNCISCHTVGYDVNTNAVNGGFDDVAKQLNWSFPAVLTNGNWASMPAALTNLSNIQCENCHGPGSQHAFSLGDPSKISVTFAAGDCAQCHDSKPNHVRSAEWNNSRHAVATRTPSGPTRFNCVRCHTAGGFAGYVENIGNTSGYTTNTVYEAISCQACHDPHDATNPHQLRYGSESITLSCGATITTGGAGTICMNCHQSRTGSVTNSIEKYPLGQPTWANGSSFGPHDNPAADMLAGVNGWTYGKDIPSSAHRSVVADACATCHMQTVASTDPGFTQVGGHTFKMSYEVVSNGVTNTVDQVAVCTQCHGDIEEFSLKRDDYDGDGVIDGVQTEVTHLIDKLSTLMPNSTYRADGNYVGDGLVKSSLSVKTNWQAKFLQGAWNWQLVNYDLSKGIHNAAYAVGLLKASIADLTGDSNNDGLPDSWQIQYFGSATNPNAAPNATPAGDGVPNWLKYTLGLDPMVPGVVLPEGVVWANGKTVSNPVNPSDTNTVAIYTAAEVVFNTEVGKTYQIEAASTLSDGWKKVGDPIPGTGAAISYVTPTRTKAQQFYRVTVTQ
jgi:hypothetical protein